MIITLPAFIYLTTEFNNIIKAEGSVGTVVIIFSCVGVGIDLLMFLFYIVSGFSKKFHYILSRMFNRVKQALHLKYHTKQQTYKTYLIDGVLYNSAKHYLAKSKDNFTIFLIYFITTLA
jgi:hypothetical protein